MRIIGHCPNVPYLALWILRIPGDLTCSWSPLALNFWSSIFWFCFIFSPLCVLFVLCILALAVKLVSLISVKEKSLTYIKHLHV